MCDFHDNQPKTATPFASSSRISAARSRQVDPVTTRAAGPWRDLSHPVADDPTIAFGRPRVTLRRLSSAPETPFTISSVELMCHSGTHLDAPRHFIADGAASEAFGANDLCGCGPVAKIQCGPLAAISDRDLASAAPETDAGDMLLISTGWDRHFGGLEYFRHPHLTESAARWIVERGVCLLGVDFPNPDIAAEIRPANYHWPVHNILLRAGVLILENLTGMADLASNRVELIVGALAIVDADGAPARVFARQVS